MGSRHFPAREGKRAASTSGAESSRALGSSVLAFAVGLVVSGCGGGPANVLDPPSFITGAHPAPGAATYQPVSRRAPGPYSFSGEYRDAVRIGIEDSPVDFTNPLLHGRVQLEGAAFSYWRPLAVVPTQNAFASCTEAEPCRVFYGDSGGERATLEDLARTILEQEGLPDGDDRWFLYDTYGGPGGFGWSELPAKDQYQHGTLVALIALGGRSQPYPGPEPVIVPMARNLDQDADQREPHHYFSQLIDALRGSDPETLDAIYAEHAAAIEAQHRAADIINGSYSRAVDINTVGGRNAVRTWYEDLRCLAGTAPDPNVEEPPDPDFGDWQCRAGILSPTPVWDAYVQEDTNEEDLTLRVWAAGNHDLGAGAPPSVLPEAPYSRFPNVLAGDGHRNLDALGPFYFPELRGQHIAVTALSPDEERLAYYANPCGELPENWIDDPNDYDYAGRHFCLAAPVEGGLEGTSFAAPFVSGVLARMRARFPGVTPLELVKKLMDTADDYLERRPYVFQGVRYEGHGFDGDIYVAEISGAGTDELTIVVDDVTIPLGEVTIAGEPEISGHVVVQRGCTGSPADYLVSTGGEAELCVVWGKPGGTREEAQIAAAQRFLYLYGAGRVDVDAEDPDEAMDRAGAFAPVSAPKLSARSGRPAPAVATSLQTPAAYGSLDERLSDLTVVGFDAMDFPFRFPVSNFVHDTAELDPEVPEFLTDGSGEAACHPLLRLAPGMVCSPWASDGSLYALASPDGAGAWWRFSEGVSFSAFTRHRGRLDGAASGAFSFDGGSSLAALRLDRKWPLDETGRWRMEGAFTLAADLPRGFGERRASMLDAGPALLSDWIVGLTHSDSRNLHTRLSLSQPPRAESGQGVLTLPSGRLEDGTRTYESHRFSLVPSRRQLTLRLAHQRPFAGGDVVVSVHRTKNRGHSRAPSRVVAGIAWRRSF